MIVTGPLLSISRERTVNLELAHIMTSEIICVHECAVYTSTDHPCDSHVTSLTLACVHAQRGLLQSVCVCVCPSVHLSTVFLGNRGNSECEMWTYYQVGGMHGSNKILERRRPGKLVKRTAAEVSVRQIEITDDRCT